MTEAARHIARDRPDAARRWVDDTFEMIATLRDFPHQGCRVPEVGREDIREVLAGRWRVIYRVEPRRLIVLTVRHARRSFDPDELSSDRA